MKQTYKHALKQAMGLGAVAGLRATVAPAVASNYLSKHPNTALASSKLKFIQSPLTSIITKVLSAAEISGDKLPSAPNRIVLPQITARVASGALVGATIFVANRESLLKGALIGGASALAATFASFYARKYLDTLPHVQDAVVGAVEDSFAIGSGVKLIKS
ncbi:DUF4126 family protein [Mucilaginibacter robiniae]|uniref:DUF4126 family protein n=1 Tax=Mucilaginibacter robiniae TaxID=2728022 RepID=A0A7L5DTF3_9SPHI|nr:DUF4126 family protein [Mucilaginibacter robiniae]QJD94385.1 DUF4126 family protein [Mucilaginibacter robiniae]